MRTPSRGRDQGSAVASNNPIDVGTVVDQEIDNLPVPVIGRGHERRRITWRGNVHLRDRNQDRGGLEAGELDSAPRQSLDRRAQPLEVGQCLSAALRRSLALRSLLLQSTSTS